MRPIVLMVPGLWNSGPEHWQSRWEADEPTWRRVQQMEWEEPRCPDWVQALDEAVVSAGVPVVIAAHSLGCVTVAHWGGRRRSVRGALLVAPTDVEAPSCPKGPEGFAPVPLVRLPFPSVVVASRDDPYVSCRGPSSSPTPGAAHSWT
jgi:predicted alpha/beta hydrolase family esterase